MPSTEISEKVTAASSVAQGGLTGWADDMASEVNGLVVTLLAIIGLIVAVIIIAKNPSVGRAIIGIIVGAFIAGLPWILPAVGELFRGDIEGGAGTVVVEELPDTTLDN